MGLSQEQITKMVREYMSRFHKTYKIPRHGVDSEIEIWCEDNLGKRYNEWTFYRGHYKDPHCTVSILSPKWCTIFELKFADYILGTVDRPKP